MERHKPKPWVDGTPHTCPDIPNLRIINGDGTKSFVEITSRNLPTPEIPKHGGVRQDLWVEAGLGQELYWQTFALATLGAMQLALEHPERAVHLVRYWYRSPDVLV